MIAITELEAILKSKKDHLAELQSGRYHFTCLTPAGQKIDVLPEHIAETKRDIAMFEILLAVAQGK
jgi:hypothetical protein